MLSKPDSHLGALGFVVALPREARSLVSHRVEVGRIYALPFGWLAVSGMGGDAAYRASLDLLAYGVRGLVSWGTCGGLDPTVAPGELILADRVWSTGGMVYPVTRVARTALVTYQDGHTVFRHGSLVSVESPVTTTTQKQALYMKWGALGVDMESFAIARCAAGVQLPFLAVRAVVDPANEPLSDLLARVVTATGSVRYGKLIVGLGWHVGQWRSVARLGRQFTQARQSLEKCGKWWPR